MFSGVYSLLPVEYAEVEAIYRVAVPGEQERMDKKNFGNHRLLWHGTGVANLISILHRGLVIAPPDAPITGHLYGKVSGGKLLGDA